MLDEVQAPVVTETPVADIASEMKAFLSGKGEDAPAEAEPVEQEEAEGDEPAASEPLEAEEAAEGSDESEETDEESNKPEESSKKPNRYMRLKAQREALAVEVKQVKKSLHEAVIVANDWYAEAKALREHYEGILRGAGVEVDPRDQQVFAARRKLESVDLKERGEKAFVAKEEEAALIAKKQQYQAEFTDTASRLSKQYPGLTVEGILRSYAGALDAGYDVTLESVAQNLATALKTPVRAAAQRDQLSGNRQAPRTLRAGKAPAPTFGTDNASMKAALKFDGLI